MCGGGGGSDTQAVLWGRGAGSGWGRADLAGLLRFLTALGVSGRSAFLSGSRSCWGGITVFLSILCAQVCETVSHPVSEEPHSPGSGWWGSLMTVLGVGE